MSNFGKDIKESIINNISSTFPGAKDRVAIWAETEKFNWKEDESVYKQKKGITAPQYDAHFDGEFVCYMDSAKGKQLNLIKYLEGLRDLYKKGDIFIHKEIYAVKKAKAEAEADKNALIVPKAVNEAEEMVVESIKRSAKKRGRKVKTK